MTRTTRSRPAKRVIGRHRGREEGACVIIIAGIHGNEPTGIDAARRVLDTISGRRIHVRGDIFAFRGNVSALARGRRFVDQDLNRIWQTKMVEEIRGNGSRQPETVEQREQLALLDALDDAVGQARGDVLLLDLHTSSSPSVPFLIQARGSLSQRIKNRLRVPAVIDSPGYFRNSLMSYMRRQGFSTLAFEGGEHGSAVSLETHAAAIWSVLAGVGAVDEEHLPDGDGSHLTAAGRSRRLPREIELFHRHAITDEDRFTMIPGFRNFDPVRRGQLLGRDRRGDVRSPEKGRVFLPLYQPVGQDGFFLVRERAAERSAG